MCSGLSGLVFHLFDCRGSFLVWVKVSFGSSELLNIGYSSCQAASHWYAPLFFSCERREKAAARMLIDSPPRVDRADGAGGSRIRKCVNAVSSFCGSRQMKRGAGHNEECEFHFR